MLPPACCGAKLAVVPTPGIACQYGARMALLVHVFKCQSKSLPTLTAEGQLAYTHPVPGSLLRKATRTKGTARVDRLHRLFGRSDREI